MFAAERLSVLRAVQSAGTNDFVRRLSGPESHPGAPELSRRVRRAPHGLPTPPSLACSSRLDRDGLGDLPHSAARAARQPPAVATVDVRGFQQADTCVAAIGAHRAFTRFRRLTDLGHWDTREDIGAA
jgi:hypothetical protein